MSNQINYRRKELQKSLTHFATSDSATYESVRSFYQSLDTPKSLAAWLMFSLNEHEQLLDLAADPIHYRTAESFHLDYLAVEFLSKAEFLKPGLDKQKRAFAKFQQFEVQCAETNLRFKSWAAVDNGPHALSLFMIRRKIDLILGDFSIDEFFDNPYWGPGVTTLIKGNDTSATIKFRSESGATDSLVTLVTPEVLGMAYPGWRNREHLGDLSFFRQEGNTLSSVPKNSKIDRIIAVEPGLNLFFQKAIGQSIKQRLKRWGVDLTSQERNQELARQGSLSGLLATVDFSSASDSISRELVRYLLPERWFTVMNACRCHYGKKDKGSPSFHWEKFSSMGNGFTFELESLIFYAAALAACDLVKAPTHSVSVYGDDVIIPVAAYEAFASLSAYMGFLVNPEKSFNSGFFRESCGAHFVAGIDVKPIYFKEKLSDALSIYKLANSIRRLSHRRNFGIGCDRRFLDCWTHILSWLPKPLRELKIPEGYGDGGILSDFIDCCPPRAKDGHEGFTLMAARERAHTVHHASHGLLISRLTEIRGTQFGGLKEDPWSYERGGQFKVLLGLSMQSHKNKVSLRDRTDRVIFSLTVPSWYYLGDWI